jgi:hypothetical protein
VIQPGVIRLSYNPSSSGKRGKRISSLRSAQAERGRSYLKIKQNMNTNYMAVVAAEMV